LTVVRLRVRNAVVGPPSRSAPGSVPVETERRLAWSTRFAPFVAQQL
jgi:hypothetical protein